MKSVALVTSIGDLPNDLDMPLLEAACLQRGIDVDICAWDDDKVDWSAYSLAVIRSSWDYTERRGEFIAWCERTAELTEIVNPLSVCRWATDKHYLADLTSFGVPVIPSMFLEPGTSAASSLEQPLPFPQADEFVLKPTVGSQSKNVRRFRSTQIAEAVAHAQSLLGDGRSVIAQPYLKNVDTSGEVNMVFFNHVYSHAIIKKALLSADGSVHAPTSEFRVPHVASEAERTAAKVVLDATVAILKLTRPLLYARVDVIKSEGGDYQLLELDICEPSLSLPLTDSGASTFAGALAEALEQRGAHCRRSSPSSAGFGWEKPVDRIAEGQ